MGTINRRKVKRALMLAVSGLFLITAGLLVGVMLTIGGPADSALDVRATVTPAPPKPEVIALPTPLPNAAAVGVSEPAADPASAQDAQMTVAPTCVMTWTTTYTLCGHTLAETRQERALIGLNEKEVSDAVQGWYIESFSRVSVNFVRNADRYCPDHVLLKSVPDGLGVYQTNADSLELMEIMKFPLDTSHLGTETRRRLELGMPFDDLSEIEGYIESLDS